MMEMQSNTIIQYYFTYTRMVIIIKKKKSNVGNNVEKLEPLNIAYTNRK